MKTKNTCHSELDSESSSSLLCSSKGSRRGGNKFSMTKYKGFTLVELIVVITILVILGTIGFVSIGGYSSNARDSSRSSDLANIAKSLDISLIKTGYYPDPDNVFSVAYSGGILWKQGTVGDSVITTLNAGGGVKLSKKPTDPLVSTREYSYSKTVYGNAYQLKGDWEGESVALLPSHNIVHLSSFLFPEVSASPGNPILSYIKGNYNGMVAKTETGSTKYLLAIPSLFLGTSASSGSTVNFSPVSSTGFLLHGQSNSSTGFVFTGVVVYSSGALPSTDAERILFASGIANAYSGTSLASSSSIKPFITALSSTPVNTGALASLGGGVVSGSLGGSSAVFNSSGGGSSYVDATCAGGYYLTGTSCSITFNYTGSPQTLILPFNGSYLFEAWGASGGAGGLGSSMSLYGIGGLGSKASGIKSLSGGSVLTVYVGGQGIIGLNAASPWPLMGGLGGWNGGGQGGNGIEGANQPGSGGGGGGGGGGASDVRIGGNAPIDRLIIGGGGGGGGASGSQPGGCNNNGSQPGNGGNGDTNGSNATPYSSYAGGIGGVVGGSSNEQGQSGTTSPNGYGSGGGGGGGGGYKGGGGGAQGGNSGNCNADASPGGGGGGTSYYGSMGLGSIVTGTWSGNGKITITLQ